MTKPRSYAKVRCSFCGKASEEVTKMVTGPGVHICNECIAMCTDILQETGEKDAERNFYLNAEEAIAYGLVDSVLSRDIKTA